ncbi:MAG: radical SAM protein [Planctomycetes bacterium]|nr:radical SAM protein [Planctomycetota bacterium]
MIRRNKPFAEIRCAASAEAVAARQTVARQMRKKTTLSANPDSSSARSDDGRLSSCAYAQANEALAGTDGLLDVHYSHKLEGLVPKRWFRWMLKKISATGPRGTALERILSSYHNPRAPLWDRVKFWPFHLLIDRTRGQTPPETVRTKLAEHAPTVRGLVITTQSLARYGLTVPQRFSAPLFCVWNFTNKCNMMCRHCYQDSQPAHMQDELTLQEKLDVVDQLGRLYVPMLALAGGEPTMSPHLLAVLHRARQYQIHTTVATNGSTMTEKLAGELAEAGVKYVEISLDSVNPARHDAFRGSAGMWDRAVAGMRAVVNTKGLRLGVAMCVHQGNFHEVRDMMEFAINIGAGVFAHFNFIPVGRGIKMVNGDLTPAQREQLLELLNDYMQAGRIGVISTAPQFGRVCLARSPVQTGKTACSHAGAGAGVKARVVGKYLGGCGAGRTYICIEPAGDVTPCVYLPHRVMGNVRVKPITEIFHNSTYYEVLNDRYYRLHHCRVCAFKNYCGGCRARADAYFGLLHAGDPGCIFNDKHWGHLVETGVAVTSPQTETAPENVLLTPTRHGLG